MLIELSTEKEFHGKPDTRSILLNSEEIKSVMTINHEYTASILLLTSYFKVILTVQREKFEALSKLFKEIISGKIEDTTKDAIVLGTKDGINILQIESELDDAY